MLLLVILNGTQQVFPVFTMAVGLESSPICSKTDQRHDQRYDHSSLSKAFSVSRAPQVALISDEADVRYVIDDGGYLRIIVF